MSNCKEVSTGKGSSSGSSNTQHTLPQHKAQSQSPPGRTQKVDLHNHSNRTASFKCASAVPTHVSETLLEGDDLLPHRCMAHPARDKSRPPTPDATLIYRWHAESGVDWSLFKCGRQEVKKTGHGGSAGKERRTVPDVLDEQPEPSHFLHHPDLTEAARAPPQSK